MRNRKRIRVILSFSKEKHVIEQSPFYTEYSESSEAALDLRNWIAGFLARGYAIDEDVTNVSPIVVSSVSALERHLGDIYATTTICLKKGNDLLVFTIKRIR